MKSNSSRPLIIGAGAAGLMTGVVASRRGLAPLLWEKNPRPGRKLAVSGNGRGNYTNSVVLPEHFHSKNPELLPSILAGYDTNWAVDLFQHLGIEPWIAPDGRIFPASQMAESLVDVLLREIEENGGEIINNNRVLSITYDGKSFIAKSTKGSWQGECLTIATGGLAHPQLGSSGEALGWLSELGFSIIPPYPVLVPLLLSDGFQQQLQGVKVLCALKLFSGNKLIKVCDGEMLFTDFGISGPVALDISGYLTSLGTRDVRVFMDLRPGEDLTKTREMLEQRLLVHSRRNLANAMLGLLPHKLISQLLLRAGLDPKGSCGSISREHREKLMDALRKNQLAVSGVAGWTKAQVTGGGISLNEIESKSFASKRYPGLFLVGELLDVWGDSGGYNLHFAWLSGYKVGENLS